MTAGHGLGGCVSWGSYGILGQDVERVSGLCRLDDGGIGGRGSLGGGVAGGSRRKRIESPYALLVFVLGMGPAYRDATTANHDMVTPHASRKRANAAPLPGAIARGAEKNNQRANSHKAATGNGVLLSTPSLLPLSSLQGQSALLPARFSPWAEETEVWSARRTQ